MQSSTLLQITCLLVALRALEDDLANQLAVSGWLVSAKQNIFLSQQCCCFTNRSFLLLFIQTARKFRNKSEQFEFLQPPALSSRGVDGSGQCRGGGPLAPAIQTTGSCHPDHGPPRPTPVASGAWAQLPPSLLPQLKPVQRKVSGGLMKIMSDF